MTVQAPWVRQPWRWMLANVLGWFLLAFMFAVQLVARGRDGGFGHWLYLCSASFAPCALLTPGIAAMATRYRFTRETRWRAIAMHTLGATAFVIFGGALMGASEFLVGARTEGTYASAALLAIRFYVTSDIVVYAGVVALAHAILYANESRHREINEAQLMRQLAEARLHVLSSQLQPHFLFNTLNAISALVRDEPQQAERLLAKLSELLRHVLQASTQSETSLEKELSFLQKYVELQETRFGPRLSVQFLIDPQVSNARVPHLLLQPLVENAIRHGTSRRPANGLIEISAQGTGARLELFVRDNGAGIPEHGVVRDGIGLASTKARLTQMYGSNHSFGIERVATGGTICRVNIPLVTAA